MSGDHAQQVLIEDLSSPDEELRRLAVQQLSSLPAREAIPRLVESLGDLSWRVRKAAVERLVDSSEALEVADALVNALADGENPGRRNSAVEALVACGSPAVLRLIEALAKDDIDMRKLVVDSLAGIGDVRAREPMIQTLSDPDTNVRAAAADALGVLGGEDAACVLAAASVDEGEDRLVRFSALRSLARLEHSVSSSDLFGVLSDSVLRPAGYALLGSSEDAGAEDLLLEGLAASGRASREAAMEALLARRARLELHAAEALAVRVRETVAATEGLLDAAIERTREADLASKLVLVQFLGLVGTPECVVPILESGQDEAISEIAHALLEGLEDVTESALDAAWSGLGQELRRSACRILGQTGGSAAGTRLREVLDDPDAELRAAAASALGARGAFEVLPDLARRLEAAALDEEPEANEELAALVDALVTLAADDAVVVAKAIDQLDPRLESPVEAVRRAAAAVLAELARPEDVDRMIALLKDPSAEVRRHAVGGLTRLDAAAVAEPLRLALADESPLVRMAAAAALGDSSPDAALDDLQRLLVDEDPRVCAAALRGIGSATAAERESDPEQRERALSFLGPALAEEGREGVVAMAALEALGAIGGAEAARVAVAGLASAEPEVVQASVACIGRHGEADTLPELIALVQHPAWAVRGEAIEALANRRIARALPAILRRLETEQDSFVREVITRALRRLEE